MALTNRQRAFEMYKETNGEITNRAIALELDVPEKTISSWKSRYKWDAELGIEKRSTAKVKANTAKGAAKSAVDEKKVKKRSGNPNPVKQFTKRNDAATKTGIFKKYIPDESLEIMESLDYKTPADILWDQIMIQYAAIIRSQKIMEVRENETIKAISKLKSEMGIVVGVDPVGIIKEGASPVQGMVTEVAYELSFAFDRQANFINALSRGMSELRNLVKQFNMIADEDDERRLKLEAMQLNVVKAEIDIELKERELELLNDDNADKSIQINFVRK